MEIPHTTKNIFRFYALIALYRFVAVFLIIFVLAICGKLS